MSDAPLVVPPSALIKAFDAFARAEGGKASTVAAPSAAPNEPLHAFTLDGRLFVLAGLNPGTSLRDLVGVLPEGWPDRNEIAGVGEVIIAVCGAEPQARTLYARLGVRVAPVHDAIAMAVGLPDGWRESQDRLLAQTLSPLTLADGQVRLATLYILPDEADADDGATARHEAASWISHRLAGWASADGRTLYLRAEAGKGKSTLLADSTRVALADGGGPLPLYVALRALVRGAGISWADIAVSVGVVGPAAARLASAVRTGLVALRLDGLDEVSGRYDPNVVSEVLRVVLDELRGPYARIALSGRTTESALVEHEHALHPLQAGIELPDPGDTAFDEYATHVVAYIAPIWPDLATRIPEPPSATPATLPDDDEPPTSQQLAAILDWVKTSFEDLGKERSLFFVQSLVCLARSAQLNGNRPLVIRTGEAITRFGDDPDDVSLYDVCILAAALACVREQDKIDDIARATFTPARQLDLLTWLALHASADAQTRAAIPNPNNLARAVCDLDSTNQPEEFNAVVRQMQKHALLFAGSSDSVRGGDWTPQFLSDWVHAALLVRALLLAQDGHAPEGMTPEAVYAAVARAERAATAFGSLLPTILSPDEPLLELTPLLNALNAEARDGSPEASANFWRLASAAPHLLKSPPPFAEGADLSEYVADTLDFGAEFSSTLAFFSAAEFKSCRLDGTTFNQCDFSDARFTRCEFTGVTFNHAFGPFTFEGCTFTACTFADTLAQSGALPALRFESCRFDNQTAIVQHQRPAGPSDFGPIARFGRCTYDGDRAALLQGEWLGLDPRRVEGLHRLDEQPTIPPGEQVLQSVLDTFFPPWAATGRQTRPYIRSSALGRGVLPAGSPTNSQLINILEAEGFTDGGREGHLYGPWSPVGGATQNGMRLRADLLEYLYTGALTPGAERILSRIERNSGLRFTAAER